MGKTHKKAWQMAPLCIFWSVWKERNLLAFENEELSLHRLKYSFGCNLWSWATFVYSLYTLRALFLVLPLSVEYISFYLSKKKKK